MRKEDKEKRIAIVLSVGVHLILFVIVAWFGLFMRMDPHSSKVIDVSIYEAGGGQDSGGGDESGAMKESSSMEDIVVNKPTEMLQTVEATVKTTEKQQAYNHKQVTLLEKPSKSTAGNSGENGRDSGQGDGKGNGEGVGNGQGIGNGNGSGAGNGLGNGDGTGNGDAKRPQTKPKLLACVDPVYPENLRRQGTEGDVRIKMLVEADGNVGFSEVIDSSGYSDFDRAAIEAAYQYRFSPAKNMYGDPVRCYITRTFRFGIN